MGAVTAVARLFFRSFTSGSAGWPTRRFRQGRSHFGVCVNGQAAAEQVVVRVGMRNLSVLLVMVISRAASSATWVTAGLVILRTGFPGCRVDGFHPDLKKLNFLEKSFHWNFGEKLKKCPHSILGIFPDFYQKIKKEPKSSFF
jgi:hypothetical protein